MIRQFKSCKDNFVLLTQSLVKRLVPALIIPLRNEAAVPSGDSKYSLWVEVMWAYSMGGMWSGLAFLPLHSCLTYWNKSLDQLITMRVKFPICQIVKKKNTNYMNSEVSPALKFCSVSIRALVIENEIKHKEKEWTWLFFCFYFLLFKS